MTLHRRTLLEGAAAAGLSGLASLAACTGRDDRPTYDGVWVGADAARGHRLREPKSGAWPVSAVQRRCTVAIVGAGVAGLATARALAQAGIDDVHLFELEDAAGGNSRDHNIAGMGCPLGAHYLPLPGPQAHEVAELLDEFGLRRIEHGRVAYDERHLCHSPQERLWIDGQWVDGLLPPATDTAALTHYRRFAEQVDQAQRSLGFSMPTARGDWHAGHAALDAVTFGQWLDVQGLTDARLRWYLDYCCRDDYGAGAATVSAWAGLHYFASRHGFHPPGVGTGGGDTEREAVLTWPEGNAWLARRMAQPLADRLHTACITLRARVDRHDASLLLWNEHAQRAEQWTAQHLVLAVPLFIAQRLLEAPPPVVSDATAMLPHAPWLVANLHIEGPLTDKPGAPPSWDNVLYDAPSLGYVDAMHQSTRPVPGPTVLTAYWALGGDSPKQLIENRYRLLNEPWGAWAQRVVADLARAHPDLPQRVQRVDLMRYGHAMAVPVPGARGHAALQALRRHDPGRLHFAHADLSAYSVFEEACFHGAAVGRTISSVARPLLKSSRQPL